MKNERLVQESRATTKREKTAARRAGIFGVGLLALFLILFAAPSAPSRLRGDENQVSDESADWFADIGETAPDAPAGSEESSPETAGENRDSDESAEWFADIDETAPGASAGSEESSPETAGENRDSDESADWFADAPAGLEELSSEAVDEDTVVVTQKSLILGLETDDEGNEKIVEHELEITSFESRQEFEQVRKDAERGDIEAQYRMGEFHRKGLGVERDFEKAVEWFRKAADGGHPDAIIDLGIYNNELEVGDLKDYPEAVAWIRKSAERGNVNSQYLLGVCHYRGDVVDQDDIESLHWFRKAAEQGSVRAQFALGLSYLKMCANQQQGLAESTKWFRLSAERGFEPARSILKLLHADEPDDGGAPEDAAESLRRAAELGDAEAQYELGERYFNGDGVERDYVEAVKWFRKAADQGDSNAMRRLGDCYMEGKGVEKDPDTALDWSRRAVERARDRARAALDALNSVFEEEMGKDSEESPVFFPGVGEESDAVEPADRLPEGGGESDSEPGDPNVREDDQKSAAEDDVESLRKAAEQGDAAAQSNLGCCYSDGRGVEQDYEEAAKWFRKAAEQGDATAQSYLGYCYENGKGVEQNYEDAV